MRADVAPSFVWVETIGERPSTIELAAEESHYVARVCRARAGDALTLTDGRGGLARARVLKPSPPVAVEILEVERATARAAESWLLCGAPEGRRDDWLVEKLAELGVSVFQPVDVARSRWGAAAGRLERWERLATAALRQSRRRYRLEVRLPLPLAAAVAALPPGTGRWLADPAGAPASDARPEPGVSIGAVGPAEGFEPAEAAHLRAQGFRPIALSDGRLRAETAALAWAAWWSAGRTGAPEAPIP